MDIDTVLTDIRKQLEGMGDFSQLQLLAKKHRGEFRKLDAMRSTPHSFKEEPDNVLAGTQVMQLIKAPYLAKETGALSFTLVYKDGKIVHMNVQDFMKI